MAYARVLLEHARADGIEFGGGHAGDGLPLHLGEGQVDDPPDLPQAGKFLVCLYGHSVVAPVRR